MPTIETLLLVASVLLLLSIISSQLATRLGVPALLLFLIVGMLAGSDGPGGIYFDDPRLAQLVSVVALAFILFAGGLETNWQLVKPVWPKGLALSTFGVLGTAILVGWFAKIVLGFSLLEGLLLGAIVSSTDAAAVFSVLRSRSVHLKRELEPLLELESGSNDPMAVFLTIGLTRLLVDQDLSIASLFPLFLQQMLIGAAIGYLLGRVMVLFINRMNLGYEGLYPVLTLSLVLFTYGLTVLLGGSGFLAVYLVGLVMGNSDFIHRRSVIRFHDGIAWLMQIAMFLVLGLLVFPTRLIPIIGLGFLVAAFLILVARPVSVFLTLTPFRMSFREQALVSWVGLRGATPIILATFPLLARIPHSETIFNLVFFIVLTSVLLQGTLVSTVARWLGVDRPLEVEFKYPLELVSTASLNSDLVEVEVFPGSAIAGKQIVDVGLPKDALILLVSKQEEFVIPNGRTVLEAGDRMLILTDKETLSEVQAILGEK